MSAPADWKASSHALLLGNFAIGCGVMVVPGSLNDLAQSLAVSPAIAGQLITAAAVAMGVGAPLLATVLGGFDRRRLLTFALLWYAVGHAVAAAVPSVWPGLAPLMALRAVSVLAAAVFTPQAAAATAVLAPAAERGRAMTTVFLGWSLASVLGMPMNGWLSETLGWRWAFAAVAVLSLVAAAGVWRRMPDGVRPPALSLRHWGEVVRQPALLGLVGVTVLSAAGQFTLFSYFAPYYRQVVGATANEVTLLFFWFGAFGLLGNVVLTRVVDRLGPARCVNTGLSLMAASLLLWPLPLLLGTALGWGHTASLAVLALVLVPWALGCFASNSAQQARQTLAAPLLAPALLSLNTSGIYLGQALGAASGGVLLAHQGFAPLSWAGLAWLGLGLALSFWLARLPPLRLDSTRHTP